jgi:hypothetical protein
MPQRVLKEIRIVLMLTHFNYQSIVSDSPAPSIPTSTHPDADIPSRAKTINLAFSRGRQF